MIGRHPQCKKMVTGYVAFVGLRCQALSALLVMLVLSLEFEGKIAIKLRAWLKFTYCSITAHHRLNTESPALKTDRKLQTMALGFNSDSAHFYIQPPTLSSLYLILSPSRAAALDHPHWKLHPLIVISHCPFRASLPQFEFSSAWVFKSFNTSCWQDIWTHINKTELAARRTDDP